MLKGFKFLLPHMEDWREESCETAVCSNKGIELSLCTKVFDNL